MLGHFPTYLNIFFVLMVNNLKHSQGQNVIVKIVKICKLANLEDMLTTQPSWRRNRLHTSTINKKLQKNLILIIF